MCVDLNLLLWFITPVIVSTNTITTDHLIGSNS